MFISWFLYSAQLYTPRLKLVLDTKAGPAHTTVVSSDDNYFKENVYNWSFSLIAFVRFLTIASSFRSAVRGSLDSLHSNTLPMVP